MVSMIPDFLGVPDDQNKITAIPTPSQSTTTTTTATTATTTTKTTAHQMEIFAQEFEPASYFCDLTCVHLGMRRQK